uniref:Replication protein A OB domain-containing protein n=1 Tax=Biomphalaria glabrata TaxID=6526 RepID=A0A2C9M4A8_BIOGL
MAWLGRFDDFNETHEIIKKSTVPNKFNMNTFKTNTNTNQGHVQVQSRSNFRQKGYCSISNINSNMQTVSVIGIIIGKDGPKAIISKKGGHERHLLTLTVRDAPDAFINVTCWGGQEYIQALSSELSIGAVVEIKDANIQNKSQNASDDKFKPWTPSTCQLNVSDNQGSILLYDANNVSDYAQFLHIPTKANNDFYTLEDIQANGTNLQGEHVNILAAIKKIWPVREILTKTGKKTIKQDIYLCDETCQSFTLTLWGNCTEYVQSWLPMDTVIFAADVRINFNEFRSTMVACTDSKTIITTCPETSEAYSLLEFIKTQNSVFRSGDMDFQGNPGNNDPDIQSISKVLTVKQIKGLLSSLSEECVEYTVIYAFLSQFDIDGEDKNILQNICSKCKKPVYEETSFICGNTNCSGGDFEMFGNTSVNIDYRINVNLSDHTGTLEYCHTPPQIAEQILGIKPKEFQKLPNSQKTNLKWNFLLERVKAVLKMKKLKRGLYLQVLELNKVGAGQLLEHGFSDV